MKEVLNDLFDYNLKIYQDPKYFKFSLDSILLAEYVRISNKTKNILDLCTGNAAVPLILSTKTNAHIDAYEIQKYIYNLGKKSIEYNNLSKQINIIHDNISNIYLYNSQKYDIITCNPPYFKVKEDSNINNSLGKAIARHEIEISLEKIFEIASNYLDNKGEFYLVHRTDRLDEIIIFAHKYNLCVKNIEFIKTKENNKPSIVLIRCVKNSKLGLKINNIKNIDGLKTYKNIFKEDV